LTYSSDGPSSSTKAALGGELMSSVKKHPLPTASVSAIAAIIVGWTRSTKSMWEANLLPDFIAEIIAFSG
jgi:hypothetical protein